MRRPAPDAARGRRSCGALLVCLAGLGCSRSLLLGSDQQSALGAGATAGMGTGGSAPSAGGTSGSAGAAGAAGQAECVPAACEGKVYACGNCQDDDADGLIDADDPECTGPCDDAEDSLSVGLPGESSAACQQDCYFDSGNGAGKDDCRFSQRCDPLSVAPDYPPSGEASCAYDESAKVPGSNATCADLRTTQPDGCASGCGPLTPNGCDCFGCCELPAGSGRYLALETSQPCTPVAACFNACDPCEACVGRSEPLPSCGASTEERCSAGSPPCGRPGDGACQVGAYCITGCCVAEPR